MLNARPTLRFRDLTSWRRSATFRLPTPEERFYPTYDARGAIFQVCMALPDRLTKPVLIPAFHCPSVVDPVLAAGCHVVFYRIRPDLTIDYEDLASKMRRGAAAVIVINYFGFPADIQPILQLTRQHGGLLIEDWAHSFMDALSDSLNGGEGDVAVYSFYKHVPTYAGGGIEIFSPHFSFQPSMSRIGFAQSLVIVKRLMEQMANNADEGLVKSLFQYLERQRVALKRPLGAATFAEEAAIPYQFDKKRAIARMPKLSLLILQLQNRTSIIRRRRQNYQLWGETMREHDGLRKVYPVLPDRVCPWAYPVLLTDRSKYDYQLREKGVPLFTFGETLHASVGNCDASTLNDAVYLSNHLLMLAVHQGLTQEQVREAATITNTFCQNRISLMSTGVADLSTIPSRNIASRQGLP